jgi:hypothetical protein
MDDDAWKQQLYSDEFLGIIANEPHKLGWFIGRDKLLPLHSEWIKYCWDSNEPRALQAFRGSYKTTSVVVVGAIRWMLFHPDDRIGIIRKNFNGAADFTHTIAAAMALPEVQELFRYAHGIAPKIVKQRDGRYQWNFKKTTTPEGNLSPLGIDGSITGCHFDKVITDDIITIKDKISRAERERTKEMVHEIAANIIDPSKGCTWIGTPWHREDAWGVINEFCDIAKYPISQFNFLGKGEGEKKRLLTTPFLYAINYELELQKDESLLFSDPIYSNGWDFDRRGAVAQLDTAFDGDHYCAMTIATPTKKEGDDQYYQAIGFTYAGNVEDWEPEIERLCRKYKVTYIYVEDNADKGACAKRLMACGLPVKRYSEGMNKHVKISTYLYQFWHYIEWAPDTDDEYMSQVADYREKSEPDDAPDSAASLFMRAFSTRQTLSEESIRQMAARRKNRRGIG